MRSGRATIAILVLAAVLVSGCSVDIGDVPGDAAGSFEPDVPGVLTVATQPLPTAGFWEGTARHPTGGVEYEMAVEMADRFGLDGVEIRTLPFSKIVSGDLAGADLAMALITPTPEREQVLDFSTPYIDSPPALIVRDGTEIPDVQTAQELQFAVGRDTTFESIIDETIRPDSSPIRFENRNREIRSVLAGVTDVAMFDLPAAQAIVNDDDRLAIAAQLSGAEPVAAALPKGSTNVDAVGSALRAMDSDGTLDAISQEWLGTSISDAENQVPLLRTSQ